MMKVSEKRQIASKCISLAVQGEYKLASKTRQLAYAKNPPGSIGADWNNFSQIWKCDSRYITAMNEESFRDLQNTEAFINLLKAGLFVDALFGFKDFWSIDVALKSTEESLNCPLMDEFLLRMDWPRDNKVIIYCSTKRKNIEAIIYKNYAISQNSYAPYCFPAGEYDLGFLPGTSKDAIDARREWLRVYNLFEDIRALGIQGFPKTFNTFEKHQKANDDRYRFWVDQYEKMTKKAPPVPQAG